MCIRDRSTVPEEVVGQTTFDYSMDYTTYLLEDNTTAVESEEVAPKLKGDVYKRQMVS